LPFFENQKISDSKYLKELLSKKISLNELVFLISKRQYQFKRVLGELLLLQKELFLAETDFLKQLIQELDQVQEIK